MKSGREGMVVGYNAQNAVDEKYQLIVHHELTQAGSDNQQLKPMFQESREAVVGELEMVVVDAGYSNGEQISDLQSSEYDVAVPSNRGMKWGGTVCRRARIQADGATMRRAAIISRCEPPAGAPC